MARVGMQQVSLDEAVRLGLVGEADAAALRALEAARQAWQDWYRGELVRLAAVICGCERRFAWGSGVAPQASCPLHSQLDHLGAEGAL